MADGMIVGSPVGILDDDCNISKSSEFLVSLLLAFCLNAIMMVCPSISNGITKPSNLGTEQEHPSTIAFALVGSRWMVRFKTKARKR